MEAFLASDLSSIYMDEHTLQFIPTRYRFSLAHEVGHWWLHDELYQEKLALEFQVSEQTMEIRLEKDALVPALGADM